MRKYTNQWIDHALDKFVLTRIPISSLRDHVLLQFAFLAVLGMLWRVEGFVLCKLGIHVWVEKAAFARAEVLASILQFYGRPIQIQYIPMM
jgi:hypothetical protein